MSASLYNGNIPPAQRRAGIASLEINGEVVDIAGELAYDATFIKREYMIGQSGPQGYSEMPKVGAISASIRDAGNMSVANFMSMTSVPVVAVLANGKTVYGDALTCTECSEVKTTEATFDVKFEGLVTESSNY